MRRQDVNELHYIASIGNILSIKEHGILSHNEVRRRLIVVDDISNPEVQERRQKKRLPGGALLHDYANLYLNGRNAMLYCMKNKRHDLAVLAINPEILELPDVVITPENAAIEGNARFLPSPDGLEILDKDEIYAKWWTDGDKIAQERKKKRMMAEILVPNCVEARFINSAKVCNQKAKEAVEALGCGLSVAIDRHFFFGWD